MNYLSEKNESVNAKEQETLSVEQVNDVLNAVDYLEHNWDFQSFSQNWSNSAFSIPAYGTGYYTPETVSQQMKNLNMNPAEVTISGIQNALKNPKDSETILRDYATSTELMNMYYKRLIRYFPDMAAFNMTFDVINIEKDSELTSKEFRNDLKILDRFTSRFNFKEEFQKVLRQLFRQGVYYSVLRAEGSKWTLQELPPDFCMITGRHDYGLLFDFNMNWFIGNYGVDIDMFPKIFKKMYRAVFKSNSIDYDPSTPVNKRNSSFVYWHQCSPADGFWAWKISPEIATIVPYFSPLFAEISFQPTLAGLQNDKYFIEASKLLVGIVGFNKENKSGNVANAINMTPDLLGKFLGVARQGLNKQIGLVALPVEEMEAVQFDTSEKNIVTDYVSAISKQSISSADAIFNINKRNTHESKTALAVDMNVIDALYSMFADFVEYFVNKETKKFKFRIKFHDMNMADSKSERLENFKQMASMGIVDIQQAARVCDMNVFELDRSLMLTKTFGLENKLLPLLSLNNQSRDGITGVTGSQGRPAKPNSDNDNTQASIARDSNALKKLE